MLVGTIPSHQGCRWSQATPFFLIHGTGARFSWRFCCDFAGFLAMDALLDIAGALSKALDLEIWLFLIHGSYQRRFGFGRVYIGGVKGEMKNPNLFEWHNSFDRGGRRSESPLRFWIKMILVGPMNCLRGHSQKREKSLIIYMIKLYGSVRNDFFGTFLLFYFTCSIYCVQFAYFWRNNWKYDYKYFHIKEEYRLGVIKSSDRFFFHVLHQISGNMWFEELKFTFKNNMLVKITDLDNKMIFL